MDTFKWIQGQIGDSARTKEAMVQACASEIHSAADYMIKAIQEGKKILWCGNGGSAADAQHLATELMGGLRSHDRRAISSIALTTDTSFLTAWTNDTSFETVFSRQVEGLGEGGDILVAISTSGNSSNVIQAAKVSREKGLSVIVFTGGSGGELKDLGDVTIRIPSQDTQRIQEGHLLTGHILCELVENSITE